MILFYRGLSIWYYQLLDHNYCEIKSWFVKEGISIKLKYSVVSAELL